MVPFNYSRLRACHTQTSKRDAVNNHAKESFPSSYSGSSFLRKTIPPKMMPSLKKRDRQTKGKLLCCRRHRRRHRAATAPPSGANMAEREMNINEKLSVPAM